MSIAGVAQALQAGAVAIVPTDTVYGLAARPDVPDAVAGLFRLKGRPRDKAIPVLGASLESLEDVAAFDDRARSLASLYWPGGLTIVLRRAGGFDADLGGSDDGTVAVRVPSRDKTIELIEITGPLAVSSANRSGEPPCTSAAEALALWPDLPTLDDGPADGEPSTVISLVGAPRLLRVGPLADEAMARLKA